MKKITLSKFQPRDYQKPILDALINKDYKRVFACMPRRAGKDITAFNYCIDQCLRSPCVIFYIFPTYSQAKKVIWDSITNDGRRILDFIPPETIESSNSQEMKIRFINGSLFQLVGSDNFDRLMGSNPRGCVFSEYALQDPRAYQYIRPILAANGGWAIFIGTPRGRNHFYDLYKLAQESPHWFCYKLTLDDTKHISEEAMIEERKEMSEDLIMQEYYTSFDMGVEGSYYAKYIDRMRANNQIGPVPWQPAFPVHTAWDIGVRDSTCIIMFQQIGSNVHIIDCYEHNKVGIEHYAKLLKEKPYHWGKHFAPHDIVVKEWGSGITRVEKARELGITFELRRDKADRLVSMVPNVSIEDGIEAVRSTLATTYIDQKKGDLLIRALENYRQEYDPLKKIYKPIPLHDWSSHMADAMRYLCLSLPRTKDGMTEEDARRINRQIYQGDDHYVPQVFRSHY